MATYGIATYDRPGNEDSAVAAITSDTPLPVYLATPATTAGEDAAASVFESPQLAALLSEQNRLLRKLIGGLEWHYGVTFPES